MELVVACAPEPRPEAREIRVADELGRRLPEEVAHACTAYVVPGTFS
jgi:hypothetical protein